MTAMSHQLDLLQVQAFVSIAHAGSFSRAAEKLHLTQPAISKRIQALESLLNIQLFDRIQKTVTLTEAGRSLLPKAISILDAANDLQRFASSLNATIAGPLNIATSHHIGLHRLPPILRAYREHYPEVALSIAFEESEAAIRGVLSGDYEIAIVTLPSTLPAHIIAKTIWPDDLHLVQALVNNITSKAGLHPLNQTLDVEVLANQPCVLPEPDTQTYHIVASALEAFALKPNVTLHNNFLETIKMLVVAGFGWSALPENMIDDTLQVIHTTPALALKRRLGFVIHENRSLSNPAKALLDLLAQQSDRTL